MLFRQATIRYQEGKLEKLFDISLKQALDWSNMAWEKVSKDTIANCFHHTGIMGYRSSTEEIEQQALNARNTELEIEEEIDKQLSTYNVSSDIEVIPSDEDHNIHEILTIDERMDQVMCRANVNDQGMYSETSCGLKDKC